jgi:hypothetical protein
MEIEEFSFGRIVVDGVAYTSDIKIIGAKVIAGWWRKNGHTVEIEDIQEIRDAPPEVLVIGKGEPGLMKTSASLRKLLKSNEIELIEEKTVEAVQTFNRLSQAGQAVSAGFHVGC